jgi:autotransporter-associated beta strand protein
MGKALGVAERFIVASGMEHFLRGGGGAPGSSNVSIIPWMTLGTIYHPGVEVVTYDPTKGIRCLSAAEYDTTSVLGTPDRNVRNVSLTLGVNKQQTINSFLTNSWDNTDIGPGSTLTITSGFISFGMGAACSIGNGDDPAAAGTINFGPAEGIIWAAFAAFRPSTIGSVITGTGGLTMAGTNTLILNGANTYTGKTYVGSGILQVGDGKRATARLGNGDIDVASGATLRIKASVANAIAPTAAVTLHRTGSLFFGRMDLESGINQEVRRLVLNDAVQPAGTYGSSASAADHKLDNYFNGPGMLTVKG